MAFVHSPKIVTDGLVLALDAGNVKSYASGSTIWYDKSGGVNNGTLTNGPTYNSANGGSIVFDGTNDYVDCGNNSSLNAPNQITLSAWVNGTYTPGAEYAVIDKGGVVGHHFGVYQQKIIFQTPNGYRQSDTILSSNVWCNIVAVYNKTNVYFYLNSIANGVQALTGGLNAPTDPIWISRYTNGSPLSFNGKISITQIYNRALTAQEITQNYNALKGRFGI
jgi:hypothetical protein